MQDALGGGADEMRVRFCCKMAGCRGNLIVCSLLVMRMGLSELCMHDTCIRPDGRAIACLMCFEVGRDFRRDILFFYEESNVHGRSSIRQHLIRRARRTGTSHTILGDPILRGKSGLVCMQVPGSHIIV